MMSLSPEPDYRGSSGETDSEEDETELPACGHSVYWSLRLRESEIRLVYLLPGMPQDPIRCTLVNAGSLELDPGSLDSLDVHSLSVALKRYDLTEFPFTLEYEALSYVWASSEADVVIRVNEQPFPISANLHHALRCLRPRPRPRPDDDDDDDDGVPSSRVLWVDALCINQADSEEKTAQVRMMHRIYRAARAVLVHLGPDADDSGLVMDYLCVDDSELLVDASGGGSGGSGGSGSGGERELFTSAGARLSRAQGRVTRLSVEGEGAFLADWFARRRRGGDGGGGGGARGFAEERVATAAHAFFCRPWWTRMWVIQEAKLAWRDPVWFLGSGGGGGGDGDGDGDGGRCWSTTTRKMRERLPALHNFTLLRQQPAYISMEPALGTETWTRGRRRAWEELMDWSRSVEVLLFAVDPEYFDMERQGLSDWLNLCTSRQSTDPRDRIFALVSMLDPLAKHALAPDYSVSADHVFHLATAYVLTFEARTLVFSAYAFTRGQGTPSWSLDFTRPLPRTSVEWLAEYGSSYWFAQPFKLERGGGKELILSGIDFDTIRVASNIDEGASNFEILEAKKRRDEIRGEYGRTLALPRTLPSENVLRALLLAPTYQDDGAAEYETAALQGLDQEYAEMLQAIVDRSGSELPGAIHYICAQLRDMAAHVVEFVDGARCEDFRQGWPGDGHHLARLRAAAYTLTQTFIEGATFDLPGLESIIDGFERDHAATRPSTPDSAASAASSSSSSSSSSSNCPEPDSAPRAAAGSQEERDWTRALGRDGARLCHSVVEGHANRGACSSAADVDETEAQIASAYALAKESLREAVVSCTCSEGSRRDAHGAEVEARLGVASQEERMLGRVVEFLRRRRAAEHFSVEELSFERQYKAMFITEALFHGVSFQHDAGFEKGDKLVLLNGFKAPMILREVGGGGRFQVRGIAYVLGLSDVDLEALVESDVLQEQRFVVV
ncbi:heterokaryon incompatibility protein-domain-containing protein [Xylariaceae sp. FL0804]|nr:heterokaryon incompatibility protein-domain-containing protein [Xylariaceae sp. FL0804]